MDLRFTSADLHRTCTRRRARIERWGPAHADRIAQCLQELDAVERLSDLEFLPHLRVVPGRGGQVVTVHGTDGIQIRLRPRLQHRSSAVSRASWRDSTTVIVTDVRLSEE